jgi:hypothetical protein
MPLESVRFSGLRPKINVSHRRTHPLVGSYQLVAQQVVVVRDHHSLRSILQFPQLDRLLYGLIPLHHRSAEEGVPVAVVLQVDRHKRQEVI